MKIAFNPSTVAALTSPPNNKDITFDLKGHNIFARGVEFKGTDTNTWRPVVDNLTSDSTTSSLSARQGKVLKALIDGKSNSGHTHDDRYLRLSGGTMSGDALIRFADSGSWGTDKGPQGARGGLYWSGQSDYAKLYAEETAGDNLDLVIQFGDDNSNGLSVRNKTNTQTSYISASGVITTGTFKGNLDWSYITNKPATATRWPSWEEVTGKPGTFTPAVHTHGLSNSVFFLNMPNISGNAKWKEALGYPVNSNLLLSVRINSPAPDWCVGNYGSGILYGGGDTKGFMSSAYYEPFIMWAGGNGSSEDSVPKWYIGIKGTHKSIYNLTTIASEANTAYNLRHSHSNKSVLDGITSALVNSWNTAYNFVNNITKADTDKIINKWDEIVNFLAGIDSNNKLNTLLNSKLSIQQLSTKDIVTTKTNNALFWVDTVGSAGSITTGPFIDHPYALLSITNYNTNAENNKFFYRSRLAFNSVGDIKVASCHHQGEYKQDETWYNVLTSKNSGISGSTIKLNGTSITVYSSGTADGRYVKKSGDTMTGALNFANGTWNLVGDDSYMGDCNVSGHFGIKAANTTYPGIAFFNNANAHLGSLTAYSGNIKYGAYSLQFLDNGNTSVGASTWTNPFSAYDKDAVKDGQAICVWGQSSRLSNLASDSGDMSLWLKRVNAKTATLNMVLDGEYYANGTQRLAHISEIPSSLKNPYALTISLNGTSQGPYDGSAAKSINITPGSIGAATSGHNHDGRYVYNYGGTQMDGASRNKNALGMSTTSGISGNWWHILQAAWNDEYRWNSQIAFPTQNRNGMYYRSGLDDNTKWGAWVKLLDTGNSYVTNGKGVINGTTITQVDNADKLDGIHANGLLTALSNSNRGISLTVGGTTKSLSNISVGDADTVDGEHASSFVRAGAIEVGSPDLNALDTYSFIKSVNSQVAGHSPKGNIGWYNVIQLVHRNGADDGPSYIGQIALGMTTNTNDMFFRGKRTDPWKTVIHSGNIGSQTVANAYHLHINSANSWSTWNWAGQSGQPSWLWGSNDGTNMYVWNPSNFNVNSAQYLRSLGNQNCQTGRTQAYGDVYTYNTHNSNTGSPTTYSSVIGFGRGTGGTVEIAGGWCNTNLYWRSLRDCCENWFSWRAVLDESNYASILNNTYLPLAGGTMKSGARISHNDGPLYIGRADNNSWLYVQDMASQAGEANWKIYTNGFATFKNLTVNGPTVVNGSTTLNSVTTLNGLVTNNGGILPASYDVNKNNTACYVWGDAMSTGVTAITDALGSEYVSVHYSQNNGASWSDMAMSVQNKFSLYANNGSREAIQLGAGRTSDLAQVQKNQLMVTFEIPNSLYSQLCWASVEINNGVQTVCTVEIIAEDGTIKNTFTKNMNGWSMVNYINFWGGGTSVVNIGQDSARFIRFKFKHDASNTQVRNAVIHKIRLFSFTKFNLDVNDFRSTMAYTGHLYKYDENLNITFPHDIKCKALKVGDTFSLNTTPFGSSSPNIASTRSTTVCIDVMEWDSEFIFEPAADGQLLFLKVGYKYSSNRIKCTTKNCKVMGADGFNLYIEKNTTKKIFDDGKSRIFIYVSRNSTWYEFYCG